MACGGATRPGNTARTVEGDRGPSGAAQAPETLYNRWKRWSEKGVFARILVGLAAEDPENKTVMIDVSKRTPCVRVSLRKYLKTHRTATSLQVKKGGVGV
jgi:hypothetical protein